MSFSVPEMPATFHVPTLTRIDRRRVYSAFLALIARESDKTSSPGFLISSVYSDSWPSCLDPDDDGDLVLMVYEYTMKSAKKKASSPHLVMVRGSVEQYVAWCMYDCVRLRGS